MLKGLTSRVGPSLRQLLVPIPKSRFSVSKMPPTPGPKYSYAESTRAQTSRPERKAPHLNSSQDPRSDPKLPNQPDDKKSPDKKKFVGILLGLAISALFDYLHTKQGTQNETKANESPKPTENPPKEQPEGDPKNKSFSIKITFGDSEDSSFRPIDVSKLKLSFDDVIVDSLGN